MSWMIQLESYIISKTCSTHMPPPPPSPGKELIASQSPLAYSTYSMLSQNTLFDVQSLRGFHCGSADESARSAGDLGSVPGLGRAPGEGKGYPLQYSGLENSMDCIVYRVTKSWTRLSDFTQSLSHVRFFLTPWARAHQDPLSSTTSQNLLNSCPLNHWLSKHLILCDPLLLLTSIFPSIRVFSNELALPVMWLKYWILSFSISPSNELSGLISFRFDWFDLLEVHGTLKSLLQHHNSKASFFGIQPSLWSNSHICTCLMEKLQLWLYGLLLAK